MQSVDNASSFSALSWRQFVWAEDAFDAHVLEIGVADVADVAADDEKVEQAVDKQRWHGQLLCLFVGFVLHDGIFQTLFVGRPSFVGDFHSLDERYKFIGNFATHLHGVGIFADDFKNCEIRAFLSRQFAPPIAAGFLLVKWRAKKCQFFNAFWVAMCEIYGNDTTHRMSSKNRFFDVERIERR